MRALAFLVHILTAFGVVFGLLALIAAGRGDWSAMFLSLGLALIVDALDGPLARRFDVAERLPRWSGATLDLVVDFITYVFVPAFAIATSGLLPPALAVPAGAAIALSGALYFAGNEMKTTENYFRGFPAVWNVIAFYLLLLRPDPWIAAAAIGLFAMLTFVPVRFVHPFRVTWLRPLTVGLLGLWTILALLSVVDDLKPAAWVTISLCAIALYFLAIGWLPKRR